MGQLYATVGERLLAYRARDAVEAGTPDAAPAQEAEATVPAGTIEEAATPDTEPTEVAEDVVET